ncbi:MAG: GlxA family transcriptional regulator [Geminicoccaceae bacterium]
MLAEAGLLEGCQATTHGAYCDAMAARHPRIDVQPNRFLVASLARVAQTRDGQIADMQAWIAENYAHPAPVAEMIDRSRLPERSFKRRFKAATGLTPLDYVQSIRLEEAKQMLETTELAVEAIATEVGYEDDSFFRRLFRRKVGLSPRDYRQRFQSFRKVLVEAANGGP